MSPVNMHCSHWTYFLCNYLSIQRFKMFQLIWMKTCFQNESLSLCLHRSKTLKLVLPYIDFTMMASLRICKSGIQTGMWQRKGKLSTLGRQLAEHVYSRDYLHMFIPETTPSFGRQLAEHVHSIDHLHHLADSWLNMFIRHNPIILYRPRTHGTVSLLWNEQLHKAIWWASGAAYNGSNKMIIRRREWRA